MSDQHPSFQTVAPTVAPRMPWQTQYDEDHLSSLEAYAAWFAQQSRIPRNATIRFQRYYIVQYFRPRPGDRILDIGAYAGNNLLRYAKEGHEIDGIEVGPGYCEAWERRRDDQLTPEEAARTRMFCSMFETWEADRTYDAAMICEVLEHVIDPEAFVTKAAGHLSPGGQLFLSTPKERTRTAVREIGPADLRRWVTDAGLRVDLLLVAVARKRNDGPRDWGVDQWVCIARKERGES